MSSRNQSLYKLLDDLHPQLEKLLTESLVQEATGEYSPFISRIMRSEGRFYKRLNPEVEQAEDIANQVIMLKGKLGESLDEGVTGVILSYIELKEKRQYIYGVERANFAKEQLSKLGHEITVTAPSVEKSSRRLKPKDNVSKPSKSRFFPFSITEAASLIKETNFKHSEYSLRLSISFVNPDVDSDLGTKIATFYPSDEIIFYSFPDTFLQMRARNLTVTAMREFTKIDREVTFAWNRQKSISYRVYISEKNKLVLTRRERSVKQAKYRSTDKFTSRCSPKSTKTDEVVLKELEIG